MESANISIGRLPTTASLVDEKIRRRACMDPIGALSLKNDIAGIMAIHCQGYEDDATSRVDKQRIHMTSSTGPLYRGRPFAIDTLLGIDETVTTADMFSRLSMARMSRTQ
eukprot:gnl/Chilomastix_caulleri/344.p1 GENE.gnl/Chilomastix_caulleri/344~~gnl/Chilomastix_caulleri/344.p1  ORF type:complete len:110 (+),score=11.78 gnl/Chilomastix_caulleri/344:66-395(+)